MRPVCSPVEEWQLTARRRHSTRSSVGPGKDQGERSALRCLAAEEQVLGALGGLVERPHFLDRRQGADHRRPPVDRRDACHQLGLAGFGGLAEEGADPARPREGHDVGDE